MARIERGLLLATALAAAIGIGACGGSDKPAYCADQTALEQSLEDLGGIDLRTQGIGALEAQLKQVERDANALVRSARDEFGAEASALQSAIGRLESAAREAAAAPSAQSLSDVAAGASGVASAFGRLSDAVSSSC